MWKVYHKYLKDNNITYQEYLLSSHWKEVKHRFYQSRKRKWRCESCLSKEELNIHHKTYQRIGQEKLSDLCLLCRICHEYVHSIYKLEKYRKELYQVTKEFIDKGKKNRKPKRFKKKKKKFIPIHKRIIKIVSDKIELKEIRPVSDADKIVMEKWKRLNNPYDYK